MGITPKFKQSDIQGDLNKFEAQVEADLVSILAYVGNKFRRDARNMTKADGGFADVTGNLRASIGYFILKDGAVLKESLKGKAAGKTAARNVLNSVEKKSGYQLVGVAGMDYASEVESRGLNVITAQADAAIINLDRLLSKYASKLGKMGFRIDSSGNVVSTAFR